MVNVNIPYMDAMVKVNVGTYAIHGCYGQFKLKHIWMKGPTHIMQDRIENIWSVCIEISDKIMMKSLQ